VSLSCDCDGGIHDFAWMHFGPSDFHPFNGHGRYKRRKRCCSCGKLIDFGADCVRFDRVRAPKGEYEENRFGDEVHIPPIFMCGDCGGIFVNLYQLGYQCISPDVPVQEHLREYWEMTGFDPKKYENPERKVPFGGSNA